MTSEQFDPSQYQYEHAVSAAATPELLTAIAYYRPDLRAAVASNPAASPELRAWIAQVGAATLAGPAATPGAAADGTQAAYATGANGGVAAGAVLDPVSPGKPRRRRGLVIGLVTAGALVLGGAATAGAVLWQKTRGSGSPAAAVEKLFGGLDGSKDLLDLYGSISQLEQDSVVQVQAALGRTAATTGAGTTSTTGQDLTDVLEYVHLTTEGVEAREVARYGDLVSRVQVVSGRVTVDADVEKLVPVVVDQLLLDGPAAPLASALIGAGSMESENRDAFESLVSESLESVLPLTVQISQSGMTSTYGPDAATSSTDQPLYVVAAKEGSGWFVSPVLTALDLFMRESGIEPAPVTKAAMSAATGADSAAAAAAQAVDAVEQLWRNGDVSAAVAVMPEAERRAYMFAAPVFREALDGDYPPLDLDVTFADGAQDERLQVIDSARMTYDDEVVTYADGCVEDADATRTCLTDYGVDVAGLGLVTVEEHGRWFVSPTATLARVGVALAQFTFVSRQVSVPSSALRSDLRAVATEMETYYVDNQTYPSSVVPHDGYVTVGEADVMLAEGNEVFVADSDAWSYCLAGTTPDVDGYLVYDSDGGGLREELQPTPTC